MASKNTKNVVDGDILIIKELSKHLKYTESETKFVIQLAKKGIVAVETMLEEAISKVGKIARSNEDGEDFADGSDAKKGIVSNNDTNTDSKAVTIGNVAGKNGSLRIMIADPNTNDLYYFLVPNHEIKNKSSKHIKIMFSKDGGTPKHIKRKLEDIGRANALLDLMESKQKRFKPEQIAASFSARCWMMYRVDSFEELCQ